MTSSSVRIPRPTAEALARAPLYSPALARARAKITAALATADIVDVGVTTALERYSDRADTLGPRELSILDQAVARVRHRLTLTVLDLEDPQVVLALLAGVALVREHAEAQLTAGLYETAHTAGVLAAVDMTSLALWRCHTAPATEVTP